MSQKNKKIKEIYRPPYMVVKIYLEVGCKETSGLSQKIEEEYIYLSFMVGSYQQIISKN